MRVEIKLSPDIHEPYAELHAAQLTEEVQTAVRLLEELGGQGVLTGRQDDSVYIVDPDRVQIARTESGDTCLYDDDARRYRTGLRLYELEERFGAGFVRISKSALIRIRKIDHVDAGFGGALDVVMENGVHEYISRRYVTAFKKRIGL
jgi:DNA-binding LytR/AlgR family response regulator